MTKTWPNNEIKSRYGNPDVGPLLHKSSLAKTAVSTTNLGTGARGTFVSFDGSTSYLKSVSAGINPIKTGFSISAWFKADQPTDPVLLAGFLADGDSTYDYIGLKIEAGTGADLKLVGRMIYPDEDDATIDEGELDSTGNIDADTWTHVVFTYGAANRAARMYVNGELDTRTEDINAGTPANPAAPYSGANLYIGGSDIIIDATDEIMDGDVSQVAVWGRELHPNEVAEMYNNGKGIFFDSIKDSNQLLQNMVCWYDFEENDALLTTNFKDSVTEYYKHRLSRLH